jgi:pimeloyl-ACP methyl ester carboxylesterase
METRELVVEVPGGTLVGQVRGSGTPLLLLHGGPGLSAELSDGLLPELVDGYEVATYQQRGLAPTTARGPYDIPTQIDDAIAVLDHLGWQTAIIGGFSYGGHLVLHLLARHPERMRAGLVLDPLGGVGDGGAAEFDANMTAGTPPESRERARELDDRGMAGEGSDADALEGFRLFWPAYFADPSSAPPVPESIAISVEASSATWASGLELLPGLADRIAGSSVPTLFVHGGSSPMPVSASTDTAAAIGDAAEVVVLDGSGHFLWHENPGGVRRALDAFLAGRG